MVADRELATRHGAWRAKTFRDKISGSLSFALMKGTITSHDPTLVRMHRVSPFPDLLCADGPRAGLIEAAMAKIEAHGNGVLVLLVERSLDEVSFDGPEPFAAATKGLRDYGLGAQILTEIGVQKMTLLANSPHMPIALAGYGLEVVASMPLVAAD